MRRSALFSIENADKYCFFWSSLAEVYLYEINSNRVSIYRQHFDELSIDGFDFSNGFKCSDLLRFEKLNNLSISIFQQNFYQDQVKGNII